METSKESPAPAAARADKQHEIDLHRELAGEYIKRRATPGSRLFDQYWNAEVLRCLEAYPKSHALDCCCGDGILLPALCTAYTRVTGLDISEDMLAMARARVTSSNCTLVTGDAENLPFGEATFDAVTFRGAFHHIGDPARCLSEVRRVLKPGGAVVFFEPNADPLAWRAFRKFYYAISPRFTEAHKQYRRRELCALVEGAGLRTATVKTLFYLAYPFAGLLDHFPFFKRVPFHAALTRGLLRVDAVLARLPLIRRWGFALVVVAEKPAGTAT